MANISTNIQVWFLRHGKTPFNYENSNYDDFTQMLSNGHDTPLDNNPGIDFKSLPKQVDFIGYSPFRRTVQTAEILRNQLRVKSMEELELLREVRFDKNIILPQEYISLPGSRKNILERWYFGKNQEETFEASMARVRKIESFLSERPEKTIILITHGWLLRLLDIYFVHGKHTITISDLLDASPVQLGHCIKAKVPRKYRLEAQMDFIGGDILNSSQFTQTGSLAMQTTRARAHSLTPIIS
ncbi:MAG: histidine phosphatase family protein [Chlorobium sp.]|jgi:broad specificity phosphatase PhoE|nr:histidine phosphatase family protein [Chlorobium sp.]